MSMAKLATVTAVGWFLYPLLQWARFFFTLIVGTAVLFGIAAIFVMLGA